jgi:hypothetical protein
VQCEDELAEATPEQITCSPIAASGFSRGQQGLIIKSAAGTSAAASRAIEDAGSPLFHADGVGEDIIEDGGAGLKNDPADSQDAPKEDCEDSPLMVGDGAGIDDVVADDDEMHSETSSSPLLGPIDSPAQTSNTRRRPAWMSHLDGASGCAHACALRADTNMHLQTRLLLRAIVRKRERCLQLFRAFFSLRAANCCADR